MLRSGGSTPNGMVSFSMHFPLRLAWFYFEVAAASAMDRKGGWLARSLREKARQESEEMYTVSEYPIISRLCYEGLALTGRWKMSDDKVCVWKLAQAFFPLIQRKRLHHGFCKESDYGWYPGHALRGCLRGAWQCSGCLCSSWHCACVSSIWVKVWCILCFCSCVSGCCAERWRQKACGTEACGMQLQQGVPDWCYGSQLDSLTLPGCAKMRQPSRISAPRMIKHGRRFFFLCVCICFCMVSYLILFHGDLPTWAMWAILMTV